MYQLYGNSIPIDGSVKFTNQNDCIAKLVRQRYER